MQIKDAYGLSEQDKSNKNPYISRDYALYGLWLSLLDALQIDRELESEREDAEYDFRAKDKDGSTIAVVYGDEVVFIEKNGKEIGRIESCWRGCLGDAVAYVNNRKIRAVAGF